MISILYDTETTGLLKANANHVSQQPYIIEFAAVKFEDDGKYFEVLEEVEFLVKPPIQISDEITRITTITNGMLEDESPFIEYYGALCQFFVGTDNLIGHNLPFDRSMLANELIRIDKLINFPWPYNHICTVESSYTIEGYRLSLDKLYKLATKKEHVGAHRAMADVKACFEAYKWLRKNKQIVM